MIKIIQKGNNLNPITPQYFSLYEDLKNRNITYINWDFPTNLENGAWLFNPNIGGKIYFFLADGQEWIYEVRGSHWGDALGIVNCFKEFYNSIPDEIKKQVFYRLQRAYDDIYAISYTFSPMLYKVALKYKIQLLPDTSNNSLYFKITKK